MNNNTTLEKMRSMRLHGMVNAFEACIATCQNNDLTPDELLAHLVEAEWNDRNLRKTERLLKAARFRYQATVPEIDFHAPRKLDKNLTLRMADCSFIDRKESLILTGPTGTGKSFIASAIGHQACIKGYRVRYFNCSKLFAEIHLTRTEGTYGKFIKNLERQDLLILDDFGIQPLKGPERLAMLEIIEDRHARRSTIIASQLPASAWYQVIGEKTLADAILDRILHTAHRIEITGESMRKRKKQKS